MTEALQQELGVAIAKQALDFIKRAGIARTPEIAARLRMQPSDVEDLLAPLRTRGVLVACDVEIGEEKLVEYRLSTSGGHAMARYRTWQPPTPRPRATTPATHGAEPKGETKVTLIDRIKAALEKHGPMTSRELRARVDDPNVGQYCSTYTKSGMFVRLGGGAKSSIYGVPGQKLEDRRTAQAEPQPQDKTGAQPTRKAKKKRSAKPQRQGARAGAKAAKKAWKTRRANLRQVDARAIEKNGRFCPALTADGRLLFLNAERGDFQIPMADTKALVRLVRGLAPKELVVAVGFIERLDSAEVGR